MGIVWVPGAERVPGAQGGGTMVGGPPRVVHHITADRLGPGGLRPRFEAVRDYLVRARFEPHLMVDPFTGRIAQFLPANRSAYALANRKGGVETNRLGSVCLQVEWFFSPGTTYQGRTYSSLDETPLLGMSEVLALAASWAVPAVWPAGPTPPIGRAGNRSPALWAQAGHFGHSQVPENDHTDPGPLTLRSPSAPPPPAQEDDDMATPQEIATAVWSALLPATGGPGGPIGPAGAGDFLRHIATYATEAAVNTSKILTGEVAQTAILDELRKAGVPDAEQIAASITARVKADLESTSVSLNVKD